MAESSKNQKTTGKGPASSRSNVRVMTTAEKSTAPKAPKKDGGAKPFPDRAKPKKKDERKVARRAALLRKFMLEVFPFILGGLGLILLVFLVSTLICRLAGVDNIMGFLGDFISDVACGLLGWSAFLLPFAMGYLAIFWRKLYGRVALPIKAILAFLIMLTVSALAHTFVCEFDADMKTANPVVLYTAGTNFQSGGVLGGILGFLMHMSLQLWGSILVVLLLLLPLEIMLFIGITPVRLWTKIKPYLIRWWKQAQKRAKEKNKERKQAAKVANRSAARAERGSVDPVDEAYPEDVTAFREEPPVRTATRRQHVTVDTDTGEVVEEEPIRAPERNRRAPEPTPAPDRSYARTYETYEDEEEEAYTPVETDEPATPIAMPNRLKRAAAKTAEPAADVYEPEVEEPSEEAWRDTPATLEVSFDDDASEYETAEPFSVHINPQETTALTGSQVDGLPDEEVVIPTGSHVDGESEPPKQEYNFPSVDLLTPGSARYETDPHEIERNTMTLRDTLESFHIRVREISCSCGPTITRFEVKPDAGVRVRSIANLVDDIALGLARTGVRIEAPIPGKPAVGIEVPNEHPATVYLRNLIEAPEFQNHKSKIAACLGADVSGRPVIFDINKMPHMLICGTTGSGKSVCINCIIMSILYKAKPEEVKMILIDPKKVEFTMYRDIPHLYAPIVSDPKKAAGVLNTAVNEMERRFELIEEVGVRNLAGYNEVTAGDPERPPLPQLVIIIDELADLMMTASEAVETAICRLAQKARAAGIHLIIGTQRPSVDVITGLMKANIPSRIAFAVSSQMDSRVILDAVGAEKLIGRGDMLYVPIGATKPLRVQGAFVSDSEVERVVSYVKDHNAKAVYDEEFARQVEMETAKCMSGGNGGRDGGGDFDGLGGADDNEDPKLWDAIELAVDSGKISTSLMQRRLEVGYGRAAKMIDRMEELGFVGPADGNKPRKILVTKQDIVEMKMNGGLRAQAPAEEE